MGFGDDGNRPRRCAWVRSLGFDPDRVAHPDLVHSRLVVRVDPDAGFKPVEADGLVTRRSADGASVALVVTVADCMPIFIWDRVTGAYGMLHSGWKGTGILGNSLRLMTLSYGTRARDLVVVLGPSIGSCCYTVDDDRAATFSREFGDESVVRGDDGRPRLDLVAANRRIASDAGIETVLSLHSCTACDDRFGSFRRQGPARFTRMAAVIGYPR